MSYGRLGAPARFRGSRICQRAHRLVEGDSRGQGIYETASTDNARTRGVEDHLKESSSSPSGVPIPDHAWGPVRRHLLREIHRKEAHARVRTREICRSLAKVTASEVKGGVKWSGRRTGTGASGRGSAGLIRWLYVTYTRRATRPGRAARPLEPGIAGCRRLRKAVVDSSKRSLAGTETITAYEETEGRAVVPCRRGLVY